MNVEKVKVVATKVTFDPDDSESVKKLIAFLVERDLLKGANLAYANLEGAKFKGANFQNASMLEARMWDVDFTGAHLGSSDFSDARFGNADLRGANLAVVKHDRLTQWPPKPKDLVMALHGFDLRDIVD